MQIFDLKLSKIKKLYIYIYIPFQIDHPNRLPILVPRHAGLHTDSGSRIYSHSLRELLIAWVDISNLLDFIYVL